MTHNITIEDIIQKPSLIKRVPEEDQTLEMCLIAVRDDGSNIIYVHNQTTEVCVEALLEIIDLESNIRKGQYPNDPLQAKSNSEYWFDMLLNGDAEGKPYIKLNKDLVLKAYKHKLLVRDIENFFKKGCPKES